MIKRAIRAWKRTVAAVGVGRRIAPLYSPALWKLLWRARKLYDLYRFEPVEAFRLGLLHPDCPPAMATEFVSRWELTRVQKALNPESLAPLLKDKGRFYRHCIARGLPIPELYGLLMPHQPGYCSDGSSPASAEQWATCIERLMPAEFVIKPISGTLSRGFDVLTRRDGGFRDTKGRQHTSRQLADRLLHEDPGPGWVLQQRLKSHPETARLSGTEYLQSTRIVTLIDRQGGCKVINAQLRVIVDAGIVDNGIADLTGSTELPIGLDTGLTGPGEQLTGSGHGPRIFTHHPATGLPLEGFAVPRWLEACEVVKRAALTFTSIRTIGWDVAVTADGIFLLEGNIWWDSGKKHRGFRKVVALMRQET